MARLYANENFPLPVVEILRGFAHDVVTIQEMGKADQAVPDDEVLAFACNEDRILLTLNCKHFIRLHNQNAPHAGIIACTFDPDFAGQADRIRAALATDESFAGQLIRVNRPAK